MKRTKSPGLLALIRTLKSSSRKSGTEIWRDVAEHMSRPRRVTVNLSRLNRYTERRGTLVVPGKVLGSGRIEHPINVAAFAFSEQARSKILKAKGKCLSIPELMKKNPKGTNIKIIR